MPTIKTSNKETPDLDILLSHIRLRGVAVGNHEMQRLQAVFAKAPSFTRNELLNLMMAVLAKDEWQRKQIGRVYDRLIPYDSEELEDAEALGRLHEGKPERKERSSTGKPIKDEAEDSPDFDEKEAFGWRDLTPKTIASVLVGITIATVLLVYGTAPKVKQEPSPPEITQPRQEHQAIKEQEIKPGEEPLKLVKTIDHWIPHIESRPRDPWPQLLPTLLLLLMSGLGFSWLFYNVLVASRQQKPNRPKLIKESGRFHVAGVSKLTDYHLLNGDQRRELRWGISRYQSEQPLNRLNIPVSVKRSAIEGMPQLAFEHSSHEREVWLWQDSSSNNPDLNRLVDEINHTLQRANISVQRGYFRGLPSMVKSAQGEVLWSNRHDYPETEPLVVVFADAEKLQIRQQSHPEQSDRSLQQLSHWPLLCFVDTSQQAGTLQRCLYPHELECILPQAVANWLANQGQSMAQTTDNCVWDSLHQWAIACALPNRVIMEDEIRALHNALGFDCAWQFHSLTRYAKASGRGFDFRAQRVNLLNELKPNNEDTDFVSRVIKFWIDRNNDIDKALKEKQQAGPAWENTRKQKLLERDTALLSLWLAGKKDVKKPPNRIERNVKILYNLHDHKKLQKSIRRELSQYSCIGFKQLTDSFIKPGNQINLPFEWQELEGETQRQLVYCGFGGRPDPKVKLLWDNVTKAILTGLATIMMLSLLASIFLLMPKPPEVFTKLDSPVPPKSSLIPHEQGGDYLVGTYKSIGYYQKSVNIKDFQTDAKDMVFTVSWQRQAFQAAQINTNSLYGPVQHWLLGTIAKPQRPSKKEAWPDLSVVVVFGNPNDMTVRKLSAKLLDTGSADQILIGRGAELREQHEKLLKQSEHIKDSQWIYINGPVLQREEHVFNSRIGKVDLGFDVLLNILGESDQIIDLNGVEVFNFEIRQPLLSAKISSVVKVKNLLSSLLVKGHQVTTENLYLLNKLLKENGKIVEGKESLFPVTISLTLANDETFTVIESDDVTAMLSNLSSAIALAELSDRQGQVLIKKVLEFINIEKQRLADFSKRPCIEKTATFNNFENARERITSVLVKCGFNLEDDLLLDLNETIIVSDKDSFSFEVDFNKNVTQIKIMREK